MQLIEPEKQVSPGEPVDLVESVRGGDKKLGSADLFKSIPPELQRLLSEMQDRPTQANINRLLGAIGMGGVEAKHKLREANTRKHNGRQRSRQRARKGSHRTKERKTGLGDLPVHGSLLAKSNLMLLTFIESVLSVDNQRECQVLHSYVSKLFERDRSSHVIADKLLCEMAICFTGKNAVLEGCGELLRSFYRLRSASRSRVTSHLLPVESKQGGLRLPAEELDVVKEVKRLSQRERNLLDEYLDGTRVCKMIHGLLSSDNVSELLNEFSLFRSAKLNFIYTKLGSRDKHTFVSHLSEWIKVISQWTMYGSFPAEMQQCMNKIVGSTRTGSSNNNISFYDIHKLVSGDDRLLELTSKHVDANRLADALSWWTR
jgi:hypothetical protein